MLVFAISADAVADDGRLAVPDAAAVAAARDLVRQAYEEKFREAAAGNPANLIAALTEAAEKTAVPARKMAMLVEAEEAAAGAGDMGRAIELVTAQAKTFRIDPLTETVGALRSGLEMHRKDNPVRLRGVLDQALRIAAVAVQVDRLEDALAAVEIAGDAAKAVTTAIKNRTKPLKEPRLAEEAAATARKADDMTRMIRRRMKAREEMTAAARTLEVSPDDPEANGVVGVYECCVLGDWKRGLPRLAKSKPGGLRNVAIEEIRVQGTVPPDVKAVFDVAGMWWNLTDAQELEPSTAAAMREHAAGLYASCIDGLSDPLDLALAQKRAAAARPAPKAAAGADPGGGPRARHAYPDRCDPARRAELVRVGGGNEQSEAAVDAALKWLIAHQLSDGGWSFDMRACPECKGQCGNSGGKAGDRCAATALALLPLLGRGCTHKDGPYAKEVERGIGFLAGLATQGQGQMFGTDGSLYSQGVAGIALAEAYAMTGDARLKRPAQLAMNFIMAAQDPQGGGWRYRPRQPGDTSASGWHLVALKSGADAGLLIDAGVFANMSRFLDSTQAEDGAAYGYTGPGNGGGTTAIGLLCRMHLGWKPDHPAITRGAALLAERGPNRDPYYLFYANQVLARTGGVGWKAWNDALRDTLVQGQERGGHEAGSWYDSLTAGHGAFAAGRLYCTSLATLILENYYRNAPVQ